MYSNQDLKLFKNISEKLAKEAGKILLAYKSKIQIKKHKLESLDIATNADYASERFLVDSLKKSFPSHSIYSEEGQGTGEKESAFEWVIDPLDGTKEYLRNMPYYAVLISLEYKRNLILGTVYQPEIKRLYSAVKKFKATLNSNPITVSSQNNLNQSIINVRLMDYRMPKIQLSRFLNILNNITYKFYRVKSDFWDIQSLCYVAMGATEAFIQPTSKEWCPPKWYDVASGIIMVEEAGGKVTDFNGNRIKNRDITKGIIASNGLIHDELLKLVRI